MPARRAGSRATRGLYVGITNNKILIGNKGPSLNFTICWKLLKLYLLDIYIYISVKII